MSRQLKKLSYRYEFLKLELEEVEELLTKYGREWGHIFGKYFVDKHFEFWLNEETGEIRKDLPENEDKPKKSQPEKIKKLYKKLSTFIHPDKGGNVEDFNSIREAYSEGNLLELLKFASIYNLEYTLDDKDELLAQETCKIIEKKIENCKNSMAWLYCTGNRSKKLGVIKAMETQLGIKVPVEEYPQDLLEN